MQPSLIMTDTVIGGIIESVTTFVVAKSKYLAVLSRTLIPTNTIVYLLLGLIFGATMGYSYSAKRLTHKCHAEVDILD